MIVLLEGANCTGKSTLARAFSAALGNLPILKFNVPPPAAYAHFRDGLTTRFQASPHFVIDRCHLSNFAYHGRLGGGVMRDTEYFQIDQLLQQMGTWLFLMLDDPALIAERLLLRNGRTDQAETLSRPEIGALQNRFLALYDHSAIEQRGSFTLPQFLDDDGTPTPQFETIADRLRQMMKLQNRYLKRGENR